MKLSEFLNDLIKIFVYDNDFVQHEVEVVYVLNVLKMLEEEKKNKYSKFYVNFPTESIC